MTSSHTSILLKLSLDDRDSMNFLKKYLEELEYHYENYKGKKNSIKCVKHLLEIYTQPESERFELLLKKLNTKTFAKVLKKNTPELFLLNCFFNHKRNYLHELNSRIRNKLDIVSSKFPSLKEKKVILQTILPAYIINPPKHTAEEKSYSEQYHALKKEYPTFITLSKLTLSQLFEFLNSDDEIKTFAALEEIVRRLDDFPEMINEIFAEFYKNFLATNTKFSGVDYSLTNALVLLVEYCLDTNKLTSEMISQLVTLALAHKENFKDYPSIIVQLAAHLKTFPVDMNRIIKAVLEDDYELGESGSPEKIYWEVKLFLVALPHLLDEKFSIPIIYYLTVISPNFLNPFAGMFPKEPEPQLESKPVFR